ncbi:MAG: hypothetical protein K2X01_04125 [Cyanobacteria bacterium]|nr:hypothetical protein [Cyanobacteriota bacterium]
MVSMMNGYSPSATSYGYGNTAQRMARVLSQAVVSPTSINPVYEDAPSTGPKLGLGGLIKKTLKTMLIGTGLFLAYRWFKNHRAAKQAAQAE